MITMTSRAAQPEIQTIGPVTLELGAAASGNELAHLGEAELVKALAGVVVFKGR